MSSDSDDDISSSSDENELDKKKGFAQVNAQQNIQNKGNSELLSPPPKLDPSIVETLHFNAPPDIEINASNWRDFKLPQVPLPNDNDIEEELSQKFDLATLYQQIRTA